MNLNTTLPFQPRENDSKSYWDRDGIEGDVFDADWTVCWRKQRFQKLVAKAQPKEQDLLLSEFRSRYRQFNEHITSV